MRLPCLFVAATAIGLAAAPLAHAADADRPYSNVDHRNDAGNGTGDGSVDRLNNQQLNGNYQGQNPGDAGAQPGGAPAQPR